MAHDVTKQHQASTTALGGNVNYEGLEWRASRNPEYHVYLFNISPRTYDPALGTGFAQGRFGPRGMKVEGIQEDDPSLGGLSVEGNDKSRKYHYITSFPQPMIFTKPNLESNRFDTVEVDVRRYVIDLINPDNLTLSLNTPIPPDQVYSVGNDYSRRGIFFDYTKVPSRELMSAAVNRMESYYRTLLDIAANLELSDKAKLSEQLSSNPDYAYAASYFGKDVAWNRKQTRPQECPVCGEQKPSGRKFHMASFGALCVEPSLEAWRSVLDSGIRSLEQVPFKFREKLAPEYGPPPIPPVTPAASAVK